MKKEKDGNKKSSFGSKLKHNGLYYILSLLIATAVVLMVVHFA